MGKKTFQLLCENSADGIIIYDHQGLIEYASPSVTSILGYLPEEMIGRGGYEFVFAEDLAIAQDKYVELLSSIGTTQSIHFQQRLKTKNAEVIWVQVKLVNMLGEPEVNGVVSYFHNITASKEIEDHLRQAQKMEVVGHLAGGVAHDFNNLLTVMIGYLDFIKPSLTDYPSSLQDLERVQQALENASKMTQSLLTLSRKHFLNPQPLNLNTQLEIHHSFLHRVLPETIELDFQLAKNIYPIIGDTLQLEQVILNLVLNARDAMPYGGKIIISTKNITITPDAANINIHPGDYVCLIVEDTGIGIKPENLPHLFEPLFTTKEIGSGTGLGLAVVKGIIEQLSGTIEVQSQFGHGSRFTIYLPRYRGAEIPLTPPRPAEEISGDETLLVVEDDRAVLTFIERTLLSLGYQVHTANNGKEAYQALETHQNNIDLLITDGLLTDTTGMELAQYCKKKYPTLPILLVSGYLGETYKNHKDVAIDNYLQKPFGVKQLGEIVKRILHRG